MPGYIKSPDQTYSNIASALSSIPINISAGRISEQDRQLKAHQLQMRMGADQAQAEKYRAETAQINKTNEYRTNLGQNIGVLQGKLEGNPMLYGTADNRVSRVRSPMDEANAIAGIMLSGDNPQQYIGAYRDARDTFTSQEAVNAIMAGDASMGAKLNAVANRQPMPEQFELNANGGRLDVFGGGVDMNNPMAQSEIALNVAQANNARTGPGGKPVMLDQIPQEMQRFFQKVEYDQFGAPHTVIDENKLFAWLGFQANTQGMDQAPQMYQFLSQYQGGQGAGQAYPPGIRSGTGNIPQVGSVEEAMSLPPGTMFIDPNGVQRVTPEQQPIEQVMPTAAPITPNTAPMTPVETDDITEQRTHQDVSNEAARQLGITAPANLSTAPVQEASLGSLAERLRIFTDRNQVAAQPGGSIADARKRRYDSLTGRSVMKKHMVGR